MKRRDLLRGAIAWLLAPAATLPAIGPVFHSGGVVPGDVALSLVVHDALRVGWDQYEIVVEAQIVCRNLRGTPA